MLEKNTSQKQQKRFASSTKNIAPVRLRVLSTCIKRFRLRSAQPAAKESLPGAQQRHRHRQRQQALRRHFRHPTRKSRQQNARRSAGRQVGARHAGPAVSMPQTQKNESQLIDAARGRGADQKAHRHHDSWRRKKRRRARRERRRQRQQPEKPLTPNQTSGQPRQPRSRHDGARRKDRKTQPRHRRSRSRKRPETKRHPEHHNGKARVAQGGVAQKRQHAAPGKRGFRNWRLRQILRRRMRQNQKSKQRSGRQNAGLRRIRKPRRQQGAQRENSGKSPGSFSTVGVSVFKALKPAFRS